MALTQGYAQQAPAAPTAVRVNYTFQGVSPHDGYRVGNNCFIPADMMRRWGWDVNVRGNETIVKAEGREIRLETRTIAAKPTVDLGTITETLGGHTMWEGNTFRVLSEIRNVETTAEGFRIDGTMMVRMRAFRLAAPDRLVVDLFGAKLNSRVNEELPNQVRVGQFAPDVVRIVVETPRMAEQPIPSLLPSRKFEVDLVHVGTSQIAIKPAPTAPVTAPPANQTPVVDPVIVSEPKVVRETETDAVYTFQLSKTIDSAPSVSYVNANTIQLQLAKAQTLVSREGTLGAGNYVSRYSMQNAGNGFVNVILATKRAYAFSASVSGQTVTLRLIKPSGSNGSLAGKVIVIDAGHGGRDPGATAAQVNEKTNALKVAQQAAKALTEAGASVILTRNDDRFIPLTERSEIANRSNADLFISIHFNSNTVANSRSGSIMFHHKQSPLGILLANLMAEEIGKVSGLPNLGVRSDQTIYDSGFAVLRLSKMPAALLELAFINHSRDRSRLQQPEFHSSVAKAITLAVKRYYQQ
ncbi:MAG TPA: N-acetylmuramoyl-L-alanine amidase [Fimbriimonadaceae bacterium]|nr:N-acetylmuramoyl-L-alanine amidase [Fimbriimonadaceae bacterium]